MSKTEFLTVLTDEGLNAGFSTTGIPTVFVDSPEEIGQTKTLIKTLASSKGYMQSYGIALVSQKN